MRELFVGIGIRLYARLPKRGIDIIPASPAVILFLILPPDLILPNEFLRHDWLSVDQGVINLNINALIMQSP